MPVVSRIDKTHNTIIRTVTGGLTVSDIAHAFSESLSDPDFRKDMHVVWDLSEADVSQISSKQLVEAVEYIGAHTGSRGADYKIAIVASKDINFAVSRMFEGYGSSLPVSINVFRSREDALAWIAAGPDAG